MGIVFDGISKVFPDGTAALVEEQAAAEAPRTLEPDSGANDR